ncbi:uncharacterized protein LOC126839595 [Adelges cooleyi]|uniref:uncharacterized protein LOC126839595 n=1 Tax=Adelges cooleyi TaxID=133065 RepID=UPI00217FCCAB|nr:uncharacterized protein LOC126839595 [Adelges cooleyi]
MNSAAAAAANNNMDCCRTCLTVRSLRLSAEAIWHIDDSMLQDIKRYYKIQINERDKKTTWMCEKCIQNVILWRERLKMALKNQLVIDWLAEKAASQCKNKPQP